MKKEAENFLFKELKSLLTHEELNHLTVSEIHLSKAKQSNKKPCYLANFSLNDIHFQFYVFQNNESSWGLNQDPGTYFLDKDSLTKELIFRKENHEKYTAKHEQDRIKYDKIAQKQAQRANKNVI